MFYCWDLGEVPLWLDLVPVMVIILGYREKMLIRDGAYFSTRAFWKNVCIFLTFTDTFWYLLQCQSYQLQVSRITNKFSVHRLN